MSPEELKRFEAQYASIQAVCRQYEDDPSNFQRLVDLIQEVNHLEALGLLLSLLRSCMPSALKSESKNDHYNLI
jgi:hypothetical protein